MSDKEFPRSVLVIPAFNERLRIGDGSYFKELAKELFSECALSMTGALMVPLRFSKT